jgi:hypothetical protein
LLQRRDQETPVVQDSSVAESPWIAHLMLQFKRRTKMGGVIFTAISVAFVCPDIYGGMNKTHWAAWTSEYPFPMSFRCCLTHALAVSSKTHLHSTFFHFYPFIAPRFCLVTPPPPPTHTHTLTRVARPPVRHPTATAVFSINHPSDIV